MDIQLYMYIYDKNASSQYFQHDKFHSIKYKRPNLGQHDLKLVGLAEMALACLTSCKHYLDREHQNL